MPSYSNEAANAYSNDGANGFLLRCASGATLHNSGRGVKTYRLGRLRSHCDLPAFLNGPGLPQCVIDYKRQNSRYNPESKSHS